MAIYFKDDIFYLETPDTSYIFGLYKEKFLLHLYWGKKILGKIDIEKSIPSKTTLQGLGITYDDIFATDGALPMEYSAFGSCDIREPGVHIRYSDGSTVSRFEYKGYTISKGKPDIKGLPSSYAEDESEADTLEIELFDSLKKITLKLVYTVYNTCDIIAKHVKIINDSNEACMVERAFSSCFDMANDSYDMITLSGGWAKECHIKRTPLFYGLSMVDSKRGQSSHQHNPFFALAEKNADENKGNVYGFSLVYSGNFKAACEVNEAEMIRTNLGINDFNFNWKLNPDEEFSTPESLLTYSDKGIGSMSRTFNKFVRTRICRGKYRDARRPILLNNWEATYFDFDEEKIMSIAKKAKEAGVELLVLDDGWFGKRNSDTCSLGDWYVNKDKLPFGIDGLAKKINKEGLKFGLWFEPEMISPDSDLYREHPDWCIHTPGRHKSLSRTQYTLDLSRDDVCDYIIGVFDYYLKNANIEYVKWDMNRSMTEVYSDSYAPDRQGEIYHRYMLGLYKVLDTIMKKFPDVLFEGCASGGGRFDLGMLCFFPQIWTSDNSDAIERLYIQYGTSLVYPASSMGAHVSAVPNHQVQRVCSVKTRGDIAMMGAFGYELDLNTLTDEEFEEVKKQVEYSKKYSSIIQKSDLYRLKSPFDSNFTSFEFVSEDKDNVFVLFANILSQSNCIMQNIKLMGIDDEDVYKDIDSGEEYTGSFLKNIGLFFENQSGDFKTQLITLKRI